MFEDRLTCFPVTVKSGAERQTEIVDQKRDLLIKAAKSIRLSGTEHGMVPRLVVGMSHEDREQFLSLSLGLLANPFRALFRNVTQEFLKIETLAKRPILISSFDL